MKSERYDSIIIGAGLTGLTIAHYLRRAGLKVLVLESNAQPGGVIQTHLEDGFVFESGPNTGVISSLELVRLFDELQVEFELPRGFANARWIWKQGRWEALPSGLLSAISTPLFTWKDKFRILGEPFRQKGKNPDESLSELVVRRLGRSFLDYAIDPFISGIYAGDPSRLVTRYAMPKLYALEQTYGSFIRGSVAKARQPKTNEEKKVTKGVFSVKGGLSGLIQALVKSVGTGNIRCNCGNIRIGELQSGQYSVALVSNGPAQGDEPEGSILAYPTEISGKDSLPTGTLLHSKSVITTTGAGSLPDLLPFVPANEMDMLTSITYAKVIQVAVGYHRWDGLPLQAFGGLIPSVEKKDILGILFPSALFAGRAPEQGALLSVFMGGVRKPEMYALTDDQLKETALRQVCEMLQTDQKPDLLHIFRYPFAIPQYDISSGGRLKAIQEVQFRNPGLWLAGNIRDGIGMSDRVKQGAAIAKECMEYIKVSTFI